MSARQNSTYEANAGVSDKNTATEASITYDQVDEKLVKKLRAAEDELDADTRNFQETTADLSMKRDNRDKQTD
eukprot:14647210-Ditylum_brightwellii.AAC.1